MATAFGQAVVKLSLIGQVQSQVGVAKFTIAG